MRSLIFFFPSLLLFEQPAHSHMITMLGERLMVSFIPYKHSISDLSTSMRAKSMTAFLGRILSTRSTYTSSVLTVGLATVQSVKISDPPVLMLSTEITPFEYLLLAPTLQTVAILANPLRQTFLNTMLQVMLKGSIMKSVPLLPIILPMMSASRPTCDPILITVSPSFTNLVRTLMLEGYHEPVFLMLSETVLSNLSTIMSILYSVDTSSSLSEKQNLFPGCQLLDSNQHCTFVLLTSTKSVMMARSIAVLLLIFNIQNVYNPTKQETTFYNLDQSKSIQNYPSIHQN